jgi:hypothetical protein
MTEQEKIKRLAKDLCLVKENCIDICNPEECCAAYKHAEKAVEAGYSPKPELTDQCPFCLELAKSKDNAEYYRRPNDTSVDEYTAALVSQTYYDGYPSGRVTSYNHPLNFCPVCGKILMEPTIDDKGAAT